MMYSVYSPLHLEIERIIVRRAGGCSFAKNQHVYRRLYVYIERICIYNYFLVNLQIHNYFLVNLQIQFVRVCVYVRRVVS